MASEADTAQMEEAPTATEAMVLENPQSEFAGVDQGSLKRERDESEVEGDDSKKQKTDDPVEEEGQVGDKGMESNGNGEKSGPVKVGPKSFGSSAEMLDYFYRLLHHWPPNVNVNMYEFMVLLDLVKKGYPEPEKKLGVGIQAFQIRHHPTWKSHCFFLIRTDESVDDFSFRKCVDNILPLPENMKLKPNVNEAVGGGGPGRGNKGGRWGKGGGGHARGGKSRK